jgi:hypothetical protein
LARLSYRELETDERETRTEIFAQISNDTLLDRFIETISHECFLSSISRLIQHEERKERLGKQKTDVSFVK